MIGSRRWTRALWLVAAIVGCGGDEAEAETNGGVVVPWSEHDVRDAVEAARQRAAAIEAQRAEAADSEEPTAVPDAAPAGPPEAMSPARAAEVRAQRRRIAAEIDRLARQIDPAWSDASTAIEQDAARLRRELTEALRDDVERRSSAGRRQEPRARRRARPGRPDERR